MPKQSKSLGCLDVELTASITLRNIFLFSMSKNGVHLTVHLSLEFDNHHYQSYAFILKLCIYFHHVSVKKIYA